MTIWVTGHDTTALAKAMQEDLKRIYTIMDTQVEDEDQYKQD